MKIMVYGWTNTNKFNIVVINKPELTQLPEYLYLAYHQEKYPEENKKLLQDYLTTKISITN